MGGTISAPISASATMVLKCPRCSGVSRTIKIKGRRSLSDTSAARMSRLELIPLAMADMVWIEQGAITIPSVWKDPLASFAPISSKA